MIILNLNETDSILTVKISAKLTAEDFAQLASALDPYLQKNGKLKGLIIETLKFPGWDNFKAFKAHFKFVWSHQSKIQKIALVTNSKLAFFGEHVAGLFVVPKIKHFPFEQEALAQQWVINVALPVDK